MPLPRVGCVTSFLVAWLLGWAAGEFSAVVALLSIRGPLAPAIFLSVWLAAWTIGGIFAGWALLMSLDGREIVTLGDGSIRRRAEAFFLGLSWRYPLEHCSNLRPTEGSSGVKSFVSFDHATTKGVQTVRFGSGLTESRAEEIAERAWERFPGLMPDRQRRAREFAAAASEAPPVSES